jgi:hypothetical protein
MRPSNAESKPPKDRKSLWLIRNRLLGLNQTGEVRP